MKRFQIKGKSVLKEVWLTTLSFLAFIAEYILRFIYLCMPIGIFMLAMSLRKKCNSITALDIFANDKAVFQHVYPGVLLVLLEPKAFLDSCKINMAKLEALISWHKYTIISLLLFLIMLAVIIF